MLVMELARRVRFWAATDRIGPDIPWTHWRLHMQSTMRSLCTSKFARFGENAEFRPGAYAVDCSTIRLGNRVVIRPGCMLFGDASCQGAAIDIEDDVILGSNVQIYVNNHIFDDPARPIIDQGHTAPQPVRLRHGCWIGAGAIILPGVTVGRNAVVGAYAVVTRDVPDFTVAVGNPARPIRQTDQRWNTEAVAGL